MPWVRMDDQFPEHPKTLNAGPLAAWLDVAAWGYSSRYLTDGIVPREVIDRLAHFDGIKKNGKPIRNHDLAERLVASGLWKPHPDGYEIHDYLDYNPSRADVLAERAKKQQAGRKGAASRWGKADSRTDGSPIADAIAPAKAEPMAGAITPNGRTDGTRHSDRIATALPPTRTRPQPVPQEQDLEVQDLKAAAKLSRARGSQTSAAAAAEAETPEPHVLAHLLAAGVSRKNALRLVDEHSSDEIERQLAWLPQRPNIDRPAAALVTAIDENWEQPEAVATEPRIDLGNTLPTEQQEAIARQLRPELFGQPSANITSEPTT